MGKLIDFLLERIVGVLFIVSAGVVSPIVAELVSRVPPDIFGSVAPLSWAKLVVWLGVLLLFALTYIVVLHKRAARSGFRVPAKFQFNKQLGFYEHKKTGDAYCPSCLVNGVESPMMVRQSGWYCTVKSCGTKLANPENHRPTGRTVTSRGFVNRFRQFGE